MLIGDAITEVLAVLIPLIVGLLFLLPGMSIMFTGNTRVPYRIARQFGMKTELAQIWFTLIALLIGVATVVLVGIIRPPHIKHKNYKEIEHVTSTLAAFDSSNRTKISVVCSNTMVHPRGRRGYQVP